MSVTVYGFFCRSSIVLLILFLTYRFSRWSFFIIWLLMRKKFGLFFNQGFWSLIILFCAVEHCIWNLHIVSRGILLSSFLTCAAGLRSRLNSRFKKRPLCHSFMALNRASDVSATDWWFQTNVKHYRDFSRVEIRSFSGVEILLRHFSL